jgi:hypothetical protein
MNILLLQTKISIRQGRDSLKIMHTEMVLDFSRKRQGTLRENMCDLQRCKSFGCFCALAKAFDTLHCARKVLIGYLAHIFSHVRT